MKQITFGTIVAFICKLFGVLLLGGLKIVHVILTEAIKLLEHWLK